MRDQKTSKEYTLQVSDSFPVSEGENAYEVPFRRWLVREIEAGYLSAAEAIERFNFNPASGRDLIRSWRKRYPPVVALNLPQ